MTHIKGNKGRYFFSATKDSGIKSMRDTQIMTPAAKAKEAIKISFPFSFFLKMRREPNIVEAPAKEVIKNEPVNMLSPVQVYEIECKKDLIIVTGKCKKTLKN